jgi:hypothetical protein
MKQQAKAKSKNMDRNEVSGTPTMHRSMRLAHKAQSVATPEIPSIARIWVGVLSPEPANEASM